MEHKCKETHGSSVWIPNGLNVNVTHTVWTNGSLQNVVLSGLLVMSFWCCLKKINPNQLDPAPWNLMPRHHVFCPSFVRHGGHGGFCEVSTWKNLQSASYSNQSFFEMDLFFCKKLMEIQQKVPEFAFFYHFFPSICLTKNVCWSDMSRPPQTALKEPSAICHVQCSLQVVFWQIFRISVVSIPGSDQSDSYNLQFPIYS